MSLAGDPRVALLTALGGAQNVVERIAHDGHTVQLLF